MLRIILTMKNTCSINFHWAVLTILNTMIMISTGRSSSYYDAMCSASPKSTLFLCWLKWRNKKDSFQIFIWRLSRVITSHWNHHFKCNIANLKISILMSLMEIWRTVIVLILWNISIALFVNNWPNLVWKHITSRFGISISEVFIFD